MNKQKFKNHLVDSAKLLLALARPYCFNELSENCVFTVTPNVSLPGAHLNAEEISFLNMMNSKKGETFTADELVDFLCRNEKVPLWINTSVCASQADTTIVNLNCSR